jgi:hypothetical protein
MAKILHGVGINDADYAVTRIINGKPVPCKIYATWKNMLWRCYSLRSQKTNPSYVGCTVTPEWHTFSNFRNWCLSQGDIINKQLDKDILYPHNKLYSPETCVFVTNNLNSLLTKANAIRGKYPIGVSLHKRKNKYIAHISIQSKNKYLGLYTTPEEAHQAYINAKIQHIQDYYLSKETDQRIIEGLNRWIEVMRNGKYEYV